jgi:hypothetical protein
VGAIVGGTIGGVLGGIAGGLGADERPRFHSYVVEQRRPSYRYQGDVSEGTELPEEGVTYYEVPGNTALANTATRSSTTGRRWLTPAATASLKWSSKLKRSRSSEQRQPHGRPL